MGSKGANYRWALSSAIAHCFPFLPFSTAATRTTFKFQLGSVRKRNSEERAVIPRVDLFSHVNEVVLFALALWALCLPQMYTTI